MADFRKYFPTVMQWEGGYVNDPLDAGGATNRGVTLKTLQWASQNHADGKAHPLVNGDADGDGDVDVVDVKKLSEATALKICKALYWDRWQADQIKSQSVAEMLVDWVWCSGTHGIKIPQRVLGLPQDGVVGPATLAAIHNSDPKQLHTWLLAARLAFIDAIIAHNPTQKRFEKGWKRRINSFVFTS